MIHANVDCMLKYTLPIMVKSQDGRKTCRDEIALTPEIQLVFVTLSAWERQKRVLRNNPDDRSCRQPRSVLHPHQSECGRVHTTL